MHHPNRNIQELFELETFDERFEYLKLWTEPHTAPQSSLYQSVLKSRDWMLTREDVLRRDFGKDLAIEDRFIYDKMIVHHMNPVTDEDIRMVNGILVVNPRIFNMDELITVSHDTHNSIHYKVQPKVPIVLERSEGDTKLW